MQQQYKSNMVRYRFLSAMLLVQVVISVVLTALVAYSVLYPPKQHYYITTDNGSMVPVFPLSQPIVSDRFLVQWAGLRARDAYNLNFYSWSKQVNALQPFFTKNGFTALKNAYYSSNLMHALKSDKLIISSVVTKTPVILAKGIHNGRYEWKVQMPLLVTYTSANKMTKGNFNVTMYIQRVPVMSRADGIAVNTFQIESTQGAFGEGG